MALERAQRSLSLDFPESFQDRLTRIGSSIDGEVRAKVDAFREEAEGEIATLRAEVDRLKEELLDEQLHGRTYKELALEWRMQLDEMAALNRGETERAEKLLKENAELQLKLNGHGPAREACPGKEEEASERRQSGQDDTESQAPATPASSSRQPYAHPQACDSALPSAVSSCSRHPRPAEHACEPGQPPSHSSSSRQDGPAERSEATTSEERVNYVAPSAASAGTAGVKADRRHDDSQPPADCGAREEEATRRQERQGASPEVVVHTSPPKAQDGSGGGMVEVLEEDDDARSTGGVDEPTPGFRASGDTQSWLGGTSAAKGSQAAEASCDDGRSDLERCVERRDVQALDTLLRRESFESSDSIGRLRAAHEYAVSASDATTSKVRESKDDKLSQIMELLRARLIKDLTQIGESLQRSDCCEEALGYYREGLDVLATSPPSSASIPREIDARFRLHYDMAAALHNLRRSSEALSHLTEVIHIVPNEPKPFVVRVDAHMALGDYAAAVKDVDFLLAVPILDGIASRSDLQAKREQCKRRLEQTHYEALGLPAYADVDKVRQSYRELARKFHPDKNANKAPDEVESSGKRFRRICQAYEVLSNDRKKMAYDIELQQMPRGYTSGR
eukprot:TRINITY_DN32738_c0_g1_i1.p1 TRINITY_DN32738_c0_g1~~TRINITY_DN32738_c0_g1_i1.p1  ORF type:complete len:623 (+),score=134.35 TRINITY_DN32738_c0_g1_i1:65-1933(+)